MILSYETVKYVMRVLIDHRSGHRFRRLGSEIVIDRNPTGNYGDSGWGWTISDQGFTIRRAMNQHDDKLFKMKNKKQ
jgi:hypothetical protein